MKTTPRNVINFGTNVLEIITPKYSPFVVTVTDRGVTINWGDKVIAQKHIHNVMDNIELNVQIALDTAYRQAMLYLAFEDRFTLQALYRHLVRVTTEGMVEPENINDVAGQISAIVKMTKRANDINMVMVSETELDNPAQKEFDLCLTHDGEIFTANGNSFQIELANILTGLPVLGRPELSETN
ncbi:hypothetical protein BIZ83_gp210 [Erwinia phage vB_EamM_ChrisDB]|uniref:hypothetical protein n=1 Tax=Erwinia phage vB_EamM_ChrisDB TaxID=1883371 RepID=UPI00081C51A9|nr:hypothetical protein BIZ83_gp210 [Erwinia phage vB_EamM_ChrisDB]ANZ48643.1 hypothetical protein CHRISDB_81 [Erwinia phage vB_EamM_ChrisDB]